MGEEFLVLGEGFELKSENGGPGGCQRQVYVPVPSHYLDLVTT